MHACLAGQGDPRYVTCNGVEVVMATGAERVRKHREKMKAAGLKPVTIWVPDVNSPEYREALARDIAAINASADEKQILEELSGVEIDGWK
ncbi:DUF3018 family protein [Rhodopseudomonas boonkerdii]|nr:DUF3018 family protein [Rhodopseudomonas boonkerdii]